MMIGAILDPAGHASASVLPTPVRATALPPASQTEVSLAAALLGRLDALARTSPDQLRAVLQDVAGRLTARSLLADDRRAALLTNLAARFTAAAVAGSLAPLGGRSRPEASASVQRRRQGRGERDGAGLGGLFRQVADVVQAALDEAGPAPQAASAPAATATPPPRAAAEPPSAEAPPDPSSKA